MRDIKWKPISKDAKLLTLKTWKKLVKEGVFIDYKGYGYLATKTQESNIRIYSSQITGVGHEFDIETGQFKKIKVDKIKIDKSFTNVVWYNY